MPTLFDPINIGAIKAPNRIFMAPMTRARGTRDHLPTTIMVDYYRQRASAGLIISEAIGVNQLGLGWPFATGLWSADQISGWRKVTEAVHEKGGRIIAQLWQMGRVVHPDFLGGARPVSASATTAPGNAHTYAGKKPYEQARSLTADEIETIVGDFRRSARNAMDAGFDGVQIHAANGYLFDQFLRDGTNLRDDHYGGSIENRSRFLIETVRAVSDTVGADRTGVRLSPNSVTQGASDADPLSLFAFAIEQLSALGISHLELRDPPTDGTFGAGETDPVGATLRQAFKGPLILNSDFTFERATLSLSDGTADAISFGRPFISNPDLPKRFLLDQAIAPNDSQTWFTQGAEGYINYPSTT